MDHPKLFAFQHKCISSYDHSHFKSTMRIRLIWGYSHFKSKMQISWNHSHFRFLIQIWIFRRPFAFQINANHTHMKLSVFRIQSVDQPRPSAFQQKNADHQGKPISNQERGPYLAGTICISRQMQINQSHSCFITNADHQKQCRPVTFHHNHKSVMIHVSITNFKIESRSYSSFMKIINPH